jgi:hypothetical protein
MKPAAEILRIDKFQNYDHAAAITNTVVPFFYNTIC